MVERNESKMTKEQDFNPNLYHYRLGDNQLVGLSLKEQQEKVSTFIQRKCNSENLNFFIGSGCSLPAVPLMGWTFGKLKNGILSEGELGEYDGESVDIENYLNWLKTAITFLGEDTPEGIKYKDAFDKTKQGLIESMPKGYIKNISDDIDNALDNYEKFYSTIFLQREFKKLAPVNIFTTNYDLFNEVSMETLGIHYTNGFRGSVNRIFDPSVYRLRLVDDENRYKDKWNVIRRYVKLYKIHGSIDWKYDRTLKSILQSNSTEIEDVMIYPTINKHLETQQSPYSELFRELTINLQKKNSTLIVIGYGFPDTHINQLISQALNNEDFNLIVFGNKEELAASQFFDLHKQNRNFHFIGGDFTGKANGHHFNNVIGFLAGE